MKSAFLLLMLGMSAWGQGMADVRVKAADAVAKNCPHGKHWEKGNYIAESLQNCKNNSCSVSGSYEDADYYHCVVDDPPKGNAAIDVPAVESGTGKLVPAEGVCYIQTSLSNPVTDYPACKLVKDLHYTCADKRRIKLQSEDGKWHCFLIPKELR